MILLLAATVGLASGCSLKRLAIHKLGNALAGSGTTFASDDDPELVQAAAPFSLKLIESLLAEAPTHRGLLTAATSGFTQYAFAFVQQEAERRELTDLTAAEELRDRARRLYLRGRDYGLRGLATRHPGIQKALQADPKTAVAQARREDVPLLYWTAAAWGAALSLSKDRPDLVADQPKVEALIDRALQLNEAFSEGAIHSFLIAYEPSRQGASGDLKERILHHFDRAIALSKGSQASPYVTFAETVSVQNQDAAQFEALLKQALAVDLNAAPASRLVNLIMQRRARWLLSRKDDLILSKEEAVSNP